jgi:hypothetical protein
MRRCLTMRTARVPRTSRPRRSPAPLPGEPARGSQLCNVPCGRRTFGRIEADEHPPKVRHTAIPIPLNGQLTYVPQAFFDQERDARDKQRAFADEFAISVQPEPGAPVIGTIQLGELATDAGVARLAATINQFDPELMKKLIQKQGLIEHEHDGWADSPPARRRTSARSAGRAERPCRMRSQRRGRMERAVSRP